MESEKIVREARNIIEAHFEGNDYEPDVSGESGIFVTLTKKGKLRGCIGLPMPVELSKGLRDAALGVINDSRFPQLSKDELNEVTIEISLLSPPEEVEEPLKEIEIGKHGIIIRHGHHSGLLLPQVPVKEKWNLKEFLNYACLKAGLTQGFWKEPGVEIYKFECIIYCEKSPGGEIVRKELK